MKLLKACIAMAAFAAIFVVPSIASASPVLTSPTGTTAPLGLIEAHNVAHGSGLSHTTMTIPGFAEPITCSTATMTGELTRNDHVKVEGNITTAQFEGPNGAPCTGPLGNVTVTPSHAVNPSHNGTGSLPWCIKAEGLQDTFTVRGGKCSEATRPVVFTLHTSLVGACTYSRASLSGSYTTHPADAVLTLTEVEFTRVTGSGFCPASGKLNMAFTLRRDNPTTDVIYIS